MVSATEKIANYSHHTLSLPPLFVTNFTALWLTIVSAASVTLNFVNEFYAIVISDVVFISVIVCNNFVTAFVVTLYPIHCRAMATSFILTCGRLGSVVGSNFVGFLLNVACNGIFYTFGGAVASKPLP